MSRCQFLAVVASVIGVMFGVSGGRSDEKAEGKGPRPLLTLHGRNSKIKKPRVLRITNDAEWRELWLEHQTGEPKPREAPDEMESIDLDFEKVMVIAVFQGEGSNCRGYSADLIREVEGRLVIRVAAHTYQSGEDTPATQAWGILIVPRSNKEVVVERDVRNLLADPPTWKEWKRFPALPEKMP